AFHFALSSRLAAGGAEGRGHPRPGAEGPRQQSRHPQVGVEFWEVQAEARGADLDHVEVGWLGRLQSLGVAWLERDVNSRAQFEDHAIALRIIAGRANARLGRAAAAG